jgi:hypothetical protein
MVRLYILVMDGVEGFALCKESLCPFHNHYEVFKDVFNFQYPFYSRFKQFEGSLSED